MIRRCGIAALAGVVLLAACSKPAAPAAPDPKALLAASTAGLAAGNYRYTSEMNGDRVEGVVDLASRSAALTAVSLGPGRTDNEMRVIGQDQYGRTRYDAASGAAEKKRLRKAAAATDDPDVRADLAAQIREIESGDDRYRHLDLSRIPERAALMGLLITEPDRTGATTLLPWVRDATVDGPTVNGTLSIPRPLSGIGLESFGDRLVDTMTFTARLDAQGRLSRLELNLPARRSPTYPADRWTLTVDGYGTTPAPGPPAPIKEAPEDLYDALGP
jgi:hypothetical protein